MEACVKLMTMVDKNTELEYYLVWGQCSETMRTEVDSNEKYAEVSQ